MTKRHGTQTVKHMRIHTISPGVGGDLVVNVFKKRSYEPLSRRNWTQGFQLPLEGVPTSNSMKPIASLNSQGARTTFVPLLLASHMNGTGPKNWRLWLENATKCHAWIQRV